MLVCQFAHGNVVGQLTDLSQEGHRIGVEIEGMAEDFNAGAAYHMASRPLVAPGIDEMAGTQAEHRAIGK